jgi:hypothetical protein
LSSRILRVAVITSSSHTTFFWNAPGPGHL